MVRALLRCAPVWLLLALVPVQSPLAGQASSESPHGALKVECAECHSMEGWTPLQSPLPWKHATTGFELAGAHRDATCKSCHATLDFAGAKGKTECLSCHESAFARATRPSHSGFPTACKNCHGVAAWQPASFDHGQTTFQLSGAHRSVECISCHRNGYTATPSDCFSCHQSDFNRATNPVHAGFPNTCQDCHGVAAWQPATFDHNQTGFELIGVHRTVECTTCHRTGYAGTPSECFSCHEGDFSGARNPVHAGFPVTCRGCHGFTAWQQALFDHSSTGFELIGAHRTTACASCHRSGYAGTPTDCFSCHQSDFTGATNPSHSGFPNSCQDCHGVSAWQPANFDHNATGFQLNGAHRSAGCTSCHRSGYAGTPTDCFSCHQSDFTGATNPSHSGFPNSCQDCHGVSAWQPANFDHNATGFQLNGAHRSAGCTSCHRSGYAGTPTDCFSCHQSDFTGATNPSHSGFPNACQDCHGVSAWQPANFDHNATGFQLNGAHRSAGCTSCHRSGYAGTPTDCFSCHQSDFTGATNPSHSGFPNTCQDCHGVSAWQPANFDHNATGFQLNGAHRSATCTSCHQSGYAGTPTDCFSCHQSDFTGATNPSHNGFPNSCQDCHGVSAWQPANFDHNATGFQLNGAHRSATCLSCHRSGYAGTPTDCFSCHQSDFTGATNPSHNGFPNSCQDCHSVSAWQPANFDHNATGFQLNGAHRSASCTSCHQNGYAGTPSDCFSCHQSDFSGASNPSHTGFPHTCQDCHGVSAWQPANFDHNATGFQLNGAHRSASCTSCHQNGYAGTPSDCFSCHQSDFSGASNPSHTGFPHACQDCHGVSAWQPANFDHNATGFQLNGAHRSASCTSCHQNGYAGTPSDCFSCHQSDFSGASNPSHTGFPHACQDCHGVSAWQPANFDHNATGFQLNGAHRSASCTSCHQNGYAGTPSDCFSCHQSDFSGASNPSHTGFPHSCQDCHGVSAWQPANFDHNATGFQLNGAHRSASCTSCHQNGYAGTPTDCFSCHQSDFSGANNPSHTGFPHTCQDCHGVSAWQPANFDHNATGFQLTGAHRSASCTSCHQNGYAGTPTDCFSCHQSDFSGANNPSHTGFPHTCQDCHGVSAWQPANFDHNATGFQLNGAHRSASCTSCHQNGYAGTPSDCFSCHQSDFSGASNPSHTGFPHACQDCHGVSAWQPANFDHNATGFQLNGAHRSASCTSCHQNGYAGTPTDCFSCHQSDFSGANNPSHTGFPHTCQDCHGVSAWQPANFDHNATGFQLTGAHRSASCASCHQNGYAGTPTDCFSCHQSDFSGANNPSHTGFPHTCQDCHGVSAWQPASFNHDETGFQLRGAHQAAACLDCHSSGYAGTPTDCFSCHQSDFTGANDPSHTGFPHSCQDCHGVSAWQPASFNHSSTGFPLTGAHAGASCAGCHAQGYSGTPTQCFACHQSDYNGTNDPDHGNAGFPTTCENCHGTTAWEPSSFNHSTYFPITSGDHQLPCSSCHVNPGNFGVFECVLCHEHRQSDTDDDHSEVGGYIYNSQACYQCHPQGRD